MKGNVFTICPNCNNHIKVEVNFPSFNRGFKTKLFKCEICGSHNLISDPHKYNKEGVITC